RCATSSCSSAGASATCCETAPRRSLAEATLREVLDDPVQVPLHRVVRAAGVALHERREDGAVLVHSRPAAGLASMLVEHGADLRIAPQVPEPLHAAHEGAVPGR